LDSTNAKFTGIVTAQTFRVLGDFQVDGTTTTLDTEVTSVDKLEVAANNTTVGVAITQSGSGDILNLYDGSSEVFSVADGGDVTITDSIIHSEDTNTKIRFPADDTVTVETAGGESLRITSAGDVGIGTAVPVTSSGFANLSLAKTNGGQLELKKLSSGRTHYIWGDDNLNIAAAYNGGGSGAFIVNVNGNNERLRITADGDVGVGEASPDVRLHVKETVNVAYAVSTSTNDANNLLKLENPSTTANAFAGIQFRTGNGADMFFGAIQQSVNHGDFYFTNQNSPNAELMRIKSTGMVGISTSSPSGILHAHAPNSGLSNIRLSGTASNQVEYDIRQGIVGVNNAGFSIRDVTSSATRLAIDSNGRILVGPGAIATPKCGYAGIDIPNNDWAIIMGGSDGNGNRANNANKDGRFAGAHYVNAEEPVGIIRCTSGATANELHMGGGTSLVNAATQLSFYTAANTTTTGGTERLRIASNGQVLVGNYATHSSIHGNLEINGNDGINISNAARTGTNGAQWRLIPHNGGGSLTNLRLYEGAGATEVINITKTGRIGVNRLTPSFMLDIVGNSSTGANCIRIVDGAENGHGSHPAKIVAGGTYYQEMQMHSRRFAVHTYDGSSIAERFRVHQSGNVGINETSPDTKLHVRNDNSAALKVGGDGGGGYYLEIGQLGTSSSPGINATGTSTSMLFRLNGTEAMRLNPSGHMGIGTNSPTQILELKTGEPRLCLNGTTADSDKGIEFEHNGSRMGHLFHNPTSGEMSLSVGENTAGAHYLTFKAGNGTEKMRIASSGYVGINEDIPISQFHVNYTGTQTTSSFKDATHIRLDGTSGNATLSGIGFGYANSGGSGYYPSVWIGTRVVSWTQYVKHDLIFATRGVDTNTEPEERFRITEGGQIVQNFNSEYVQKGYFNTLRSSQNATNCPALATNLSYGFGYQEAFSTTGGAWSYPYPNLVLGYHTGVMIGGHINYQGTRFYADHPSSTSTVLMSVGNGSYNVAVTNTLSKGGGTFRIAHPHPSKKYTHDLQHSFIEGPQCDNLYRGRVDLVDGTASINIDTVSNMTDGTFVLLNRDIQCFTSNETGWTAVKGSVSGNILTITAKSSSCTDTISWMVIGERQDDKIKSPEMEMTDSDGKLIVEPLTIEESHL
jgi:hypothetical protein